MRRKVNLTLEEDVVRRAKIAAAARKRSLSSVVEESLKHLEEEFGSFEDDLSRFHREHLPRGFHEPTDRELERIKESRTRKEK